MGNYHHHQNPSAFNLDLNVVSNVCDLYTADGLYAIDSTRHSPLLGFAYDGFPIYGAYGYANADGTGGITRLRSGYQLRNITVRNTYANGSSVTPGPNVSTTYPLGYFREDYEFLSHAEPYYLDAHNGRYCITPEYPGGTYAYFCTVDANWNSAYPYIIGPTFYGVVTGAKVTSIPQGVTTYNWVRLAARVFLQGPYDSGSGLMDDGLRAASLLPTTQPYTALGYSFVGTSIGDGTVAPGVFTTTTGNNAIVDHVVVELRNALTPSTVLASCPALLQRDGDVVALDGRAALTVAIAPGTYHVAIRHRNHLGVMTGTAQALGNSTVTVDLSSAATVVHGTDATAISGSVRLLWSGDVSYNKTLSYTGSGNDRDPVLVTVGSTAPNNTVVAYSASDVDMDGVVKYTGSGNDRDPILVNIGGTTPNTVRSEQLP